MDYSFLLLLSVIIAIGGIIVLPLVPVLLKSTINIVTTSIFALATSIPAICALTTFPLEYSISIAHSLGSVPIRIDPLSAWFMLIINFTAITGAIYGAGYMKQYASRKQSLSLHWIMYILFHASMIWVCMIQNSLLFLVIWEIMSLSSMFLIIFDHENKKVLKAGINYFIQMHVGVVFLTAAVVWVYMSEHSFDFNAIGHFFTTHKNIWLFLLFFIGFGIKSGFIVIHTWLPQAHPAAPSHVSGVMSGVIVKLGIYGIFRIITLLHNDFTLIGESILGLSLITGLFGILSAALQRNIKKMLAYCTIENIGIIGMGIGLGLIGMGTGHQIFVVAGFGSALLHTLNHSLYKSLLFFSAGSVYTQTHTRNMEKLGGLIRWMPHTAILFLVGSLAIAGLPPFNGFVSEFILYSGLLSGIKVSGFYQVTLYVLSIAALSIIGGISLLAFTKSFGTMFLGIPRTEYKHEPKEVSVAMRVPQYFIVAILLSIGLFPQVYFRVVSNILAIMFPQLLIANVSDVDSYLLTISQIGKYAFLFMLLIGFIFIARVLFSRQKLAPREATWGCGYTAPNTSMQYTGKSYSKSLGKLLTFVVPEKKKFSEINASEIFPEERSHSSNYTDTFEQFVNWISARLVRLLNYFQFIQNGDIQMYVLYGIVFIIVVFAGTLFNFM